ncbi:peptidoglycan editing factor PgeF [Pelagibacteraceae bacterium]|nr:peptidoglycan editing factor PgeF [Pelagibacteraceae bacterium]
MFYSKKLKKIKEIKHCFFSKKNGFSKGIYKSLNCGMGSSDKKNNIIKNLNYVKKKMSLKKNSLVLMNQTHSNKVVEIKKKIIGSKKINCDAIITRIKGLGLGVVTADCVPIIVYDAKNKIIGCIHAGWKGAYSGIIKNTIIKIKKISSGNEIYASVGPCIGENSYEVDSKFYRKFLSSSKENKKYFLRKNNKKKLFNLRKYVSDKLTDLKVKVDNVNHDTFKENHNFFSYRRSYKLKQKDYGRCISVVSLI